MSYTRLVAYTIAPALLLGVAAGLAVSTILGIVADVLVIGLLLDRRRKSSTRLGSTEPAAAAPRRR
jgi:hypothetical protein